MVATHGRPDLLVDCIGAIVEACGANDEVIIAASGDDGASAALARGQVRVLACDDRRKDAKVNLAAGLAAADVILLTDDDCIVDKGWVDAMVAAFADPEVGVAFGPVRGLTEVPGGEGAPVVPPGPGPLENWTYAHGASMAVRRDALLDVGGFDERLGPGASAAGEEADLVVRLAAAGWRSVVADAPLVRHVGWRDAAQETANQLVYERGAGVWIGAGLRRDFRRIAPLARLRLRYQRGMYEDRRTRGLLFGPRTSVAFGAGIIEGLRMPPRRFTTRPGTVPRVLWVTAAPLDRPTPEHLLLSAVCDRATTTVMAAGAVADELRARAAEVVTLPTGGRAQRREVRRREANVDLVVVGDRRMAALARARRSARWILDAGEAGVGRRVAASYDGFVVSSPDEADALRTRWRVPVWAPSDGGHRSRPGPGAMATEDRVTFPAASVLAARLLATLPSGQRR